MSWLHAILLGVLEGLTEFVPVSSTGHLILASRALRLHGAGIDSFTIVIQLGALLAAILYYRRILYQTARGLLRSEPQAVRLFVALCLGALPALLIGYLFGKRIKAALFSPVTVAAALGVGGVLMILVDRWHRRLREAGSTTADLGAISPRQVMIVGAAQVAALWPGTSRSMACIIGGQLARLSGAAAADFAFLLAIPTLGAATLYDLMKNHKALMAETGALELLLGLGTSFVVGWLVIAAFLRYLRRFGLAAFGYYRIALGLLVLWFM
jgi:undecaprenyl-diphosphatase